MNFKRVIKKTILFNLLRIRPGLLNNYSFKEFLKLPLFIDCNRSTILCEIMFKNGTDKGMYAGISKHNYTPVYHAFLKKSIKSKIRLFELGIGTINPNIESNMGSKGRPGASLRGWKEYFKQGEIFGADIDESILVNEDRISTYFCDQTKPHSINKMWNNNIELAGLFDLIIDDGLHTFDANKCFLENSFEKLRNNGLYIIEDVVKSELTNWDNFLKYFNLNICSIKYLILKIPNRYNYYDNNLIVIRKNTINYNI